MSLTQAPRVATPSEKKGEAMLRDLPDTMMEGESDEVRWFFEILLKEWEEEQRENDKEGSPDHTL